MLPTAILRRITWVVLITFSSLVTQPLQAAVQMQKAGKSGKVVKAGKSYATRPAVPETLAEKQSRLLAEIHDLLKELEPESARPVPPGAGDKGGE